MLYLDDLKYMKLYKKQFFAPINKDDRKHNSAILLLTRNPLYSNEMMFNKFMVNRKTFISYYIEKDIMYTINNESRLLERDYYDNLNVLNEASAEVYHETTDLYFGESMDEDFFNEFFVKSGNTLQFFNEMYDEKIYNEVAGVNQKYKRLLYVDRLKNNRDVVKLYKDMKKNFPEMAQYKTYLDYKKYKGLNLFIDLRYYIDTFLNNNTFKIIQSRSLFFEFLRRSIMDKRITEAGYTKKTVLVPIDGMAWSADTSIDAPEIYDFRKLLNPISLFYNKLKFDPEALINAFGDMDFVFMGKEGYFKFNPTKINTQTRVMFITLLDKLRNNEPIEDDEPDNSPAGITTDIADKLEANKGIKIHNLTGETNSDDEDERLKADLVKKINDASEQSPDEETALDRMDKGSMADDSIPAADIIAALSTDADDNIKLSAARVNRIKDTQDKFYQRQINGKSVKDMVNESNKPAELPEVALPIKSINEEWKHLKAINFEKEYDLDADIVKILNSLSDTNKHYPVSILDMTIEDTSTSEDWIYTYTVKCEDYSGKRFTLKFDIPKLRDDRFMRLRSNEKIFSIEMPLIPISKTDEDTTQIVSFYNKIFIERYYTSTGKSMPWMSKFIKRLNEDPNCICELGDNTKICQKYELPIDYIDMATIFNTITISTPNTKLADQVTIMFNQDELRKTIAPFKVDPMRLPIGICSDKVIYYDRNMLDTIKQQYLNVTGKNIDISGTGSKWTYSRASILNTNIPVIVILAHDIGLIKAMDIAGVKYTITDKRHSVDNNEIQIKLADGYIYYMATSEALMLMGGLNECDMGSIKIAELNSKMTWVDQLDNFGGRVKTDGLDNFADLMYDPITIEVSKDYKLPETYHEALIYASNLLVDNKYIKHTDLSTNRYRTNEVIAAQFYRALSSSYKEYALSNKHGRKVAMSMKQSAVIDLILAQNTTSDLSVFQPLLEIEAKNTISTKGVTGMNSERAYKMDKRGYTDSMLNIIAQATGFASTVGVNRQTTINPNIVGGRGYFKQSGTDNMNIVNSMSMTEALSPNALTHNDPFRNDMSFIQTSKHGTPIEYATPALVTTGADAAMPYLCSNMFAHKSKMAGKVTELTDKYMIVEYRDGSKDFINLDEQTMKNSDGGFYITLQLKTDLKEGQGFKEGAILAYDKKSFSNIVGDGKQLCYNQGILTKVAIITSEDGYEDSASISDWLSEMMASDVVVSKPVILEPQTNVLYLAKKGQTVKEGEPILIFQSPFDEEDANVLIKNLNVEDGDISEIGRNIIKSKVTGVIQDIKIYRTVDIEELSDSLQKIVKAKETEINKLKRASAGSLSPAQLDPTGKLEMNGKLKNVDGILIEIYMKYHDKFQIGSKQVVESANKNVIYNIYSDEDAPYTDARPTEAIDSITSCSSLDGRMVISPIINGGLNKAMIELSRKCKEIYGVKWETIHEIYQNEINKR